MSGINEKSFSELKIDSLITLDKIKDMVNTMLKTQAVTPVFDQTYIENKLNDLVYEMSKHEFNMDSEISYVKLLSSIKQTLDGVIELISATKEMSNNGCPFVEIKSVKSTDEDYTHNNPFIPYIYLYSKCYYVDSYYQTVDLYDCNTKLKTYKGESATYNLKLTNGSPIPTINDYYNIEETKWTVKLVINDDIISKNIVVKDSENKDIPLAMYSFVLSELVKNSDYAIVNIKKRNDGLLYAQVKINFVYPNNDTADYPSKFFNLEETLGLSDSDVYRLNDDNEITNVPIEELSFNLKVVDERQYR